MGRGGLYLWASGGEQLNWDTCNSGASLSFGTFSAVCEPPSSARPVSLGSWAPRGFPGCSDYRCGSAGPDPAGQKREGHFPPARSVTRKNPASWMAGGLQGNWRRSGVNTGHKRGGAEWRLLEAAASGRGLPARGGETHQPSAAHCASARCRVPEAKTPRSRTVPRCAWRRPPG